METLSFEDTAIVACGTMRPELAYLRDQGFLDTPHLFYTTPGLHQEIHELERQLIRFIKKAKDKADKVIVVYGGKYCYVNADSPTRLMQTSLKVGHLAFYDVTGRIARTLLDLCQEPDAMTHPDGMQIKVTRQELGRIVGCSREMVSRVLKNLEEQDLIAVKGKTIVVHGAR